MLNIAFLTIKGVFRDNVFRGIVIATVFFLLIPTVSTLSMRQVTELSLTLSLSLISFILLLLSLFLGGTSLWKDMDRKYTFSVLSLPLSRPSYLLGKFFGISGFILITACVLGMAASLVVSFVSGAYPPDRPVVWLNIWVAVIFDAFKYILLVSCAFLLSTISTSFFLPIFGTISLFIMGSAMQGAYEFVRFSAGPDFPSAVKYIVGFFYYVLPNFSAFDLKVNATYAIPLSFNGIALVFSYFIIYCGIMLSAAALVFSKREMQ